MPVLINRIIIRLKCDSFPYLIHNMIPPVCNLFEKCLETETVNKDKNRKINKFNLHSLLPDIFYYSRRLPDYWVSK